MSTQTDIPQEALRPKTAHMRSKQDRELEAEKIRQDFVRTKRSSFRENFQELCSAVKTPSLCKQDDAKLVDDYLKSLDIEAVNALLGKVLSELRLRENEQMQVDVITHSQRLRVKNLSRDR